MTRRVDYIKASIIRKSFDKAVSIKNVINLSIGQPDFPVPSSTKRAMIKAIKDDKAGYTPSAGIKSLRDKILSKYSGMKFAEGAIVTSGVSGGIFLVYAALLEEGDELIVLSPYFVSYPDIAGFLNIKPVIVSTNDDFSLNFENIKRAITPKTKAIIVNSPNNPTGHIFSGQEIKMLVDVAKENNLWIISDEVYEAFDYEKTFETIGKYYDKTIVLNGYSKSLALTGMRVGYAVGPKPVIDDMIKLQQYTFVCAPSIAQVGIDESVDVVDSKKIARFKKRRDFVYDELKNVVKIGKPAGAFYYFIPLPKEITADDFVERCLSKKLLVVPGNAFMEGCDGQKYFRISYAVDEDTLKRGIKVIKSIL